MKNYFCLAFIISLHVANLFSQGNDYRLQIKNAATGEAVEYAAVYFGNERGSYTNEKGEIKIPFDVKEIEISHLLYETKKLSLTHGLSDIFLNPKQNILQEVVVLPSNTKKEKIGYHKEKSNYFSIANYGRVVAQYLSYKKQNDEDMPLIESMILRFNNMQPSVSQEKEWGIKSYKATLRIDLRLPDKETGAPSDNSLIDGGVIFDGKYKDKKQTIINLPNYVSFPEEGVFVVLEWIVPEELSDEHYVTDPLVMMFPSDENHMWEKRIYSEQKYWIQREKANEPFIKHDPKSKDKYVNLGVGLVIVK